jgi:hypothetical protein
MLFTSPIFSQASGSIGGTTFAHNRGGMYTRARVTPTDPSSEYQQTVRAAMGSLAPYWSQTLTPEERLAWKDYAANVAMTNRLGQTVYLTGQQHFIRCNVPRIQAGIAILEAAPTTYDLGTFTPPTIDEITDDSAISVAFTNTDDWAIAVGGYLLIYGGKNQGVGRGFYKGPWRYAGKIAGAVEPPSSPGSATSRYVPVVGNLMWLQCRIIQVDGRLSLPIVLGPEIVAAA